MSGNIVGLSSSVEEAPRKPRKLAVCFSRVVPYAGIDNGGGGLLQSYVEETAMEVSRVLVAPADARNLAAMAKSDLEIYAMGRGEQRHRTAARIDGRLRAEYLAGMPSSFFLRACVTSPAIRALIEKADIIEYQWQDMASLLPWASGVAKAEARHVVFLHDVVSQRLHRVMSEAAPGRRLALRASEMLHRRCERRICRLADAVIVLSDKDADLLPSAAPIYVARPPVRVRALAKRLREAPISPTFIFVGAFNRPENAQAAQWLATEIWPEIRRLVPTASLRLVGSGEAAAIDRLAVATPGWVRTGYVEDLDIEYQNAHVALVPLRLGAGVKIKTLEAMATATPVVATSVGAEGIDVARELLALADDPSEFAEAAVAAALDAGGAATARAEAARDWASLNHGREQFRAAVWGALGL